MPDPFKIEKHVPMPEERHAGNFSKYPFRNMKVGDSFLTPMVEKYEIKRAVQNANFTKRHGRFTYRQEANGVRVWRVK